MTEDCGNCDGTGQVGWDFVVDGHNSGHQPVWCWQCEASGECQARTPCRIEEEA